MPSASDGPRDRSQLYNIKTKIKVKRKSRNTGPVVVPNFAKLIADMDAGDFVKNVDFSFRSKDQRIYPNTFAMTDTAVNWVRTFCSPSSRTKSQLGIDMTYKVGPFYTTCLSFPHPHLVHKHDGQTNPTLFVGMMTSTGRKEADYNYLANQMKSSGIKNLVYGTDGELALEKGFEAVYPIETLNSCDKNIKLRCFNHVKDDILVQLKKDSLTGNLANDIVNEILGKEGNGLRSPGLVDVSSDMFEQKYQSLTAKWPQSFRNYLESEQLRVRSLKSTLLRCMGKDVRIEAGLGNPPHKYDNQRAESINNVLKESIGNQYVDQSAVHGLVYENIVKPQENEIIKAIYGSGQYRLAGSLSQFEITNEQWKTMTENQRTHLVEKVLNFHSHNSKNITQKVVTRKLSIQPHDCGAYLSSLPASLIKQLWNTAEIILTNDLIRDLDNGNVCVTEGDSAYIIKQVNDTFICKCTMYVKYNICSHILVVADERSSLICFLSNYKYSPSVAVNKHNQKGRGKRKPKNLEKGHKK